MRTTETDHEAQTECVNCVRKDRDIARKDRNIERQAGLIVALQTRVDLAESRAAHAEKQVSRLQYYASRGQVGERRTAKRIMAIFDEMVSDPDWEGQVSMGFAATFDQAVGVDLDCDD